MLYKNVCNLGLKIYKDIELPWAAFDGIKKVLLKHVIMDTSEKYVCIDGMTIKQGLTVIKAL